jgi:hypothetical protein
MSRIVTFPFVLGLRKQASRIPTVEIEDGRFEI